MSRNNELRLFVSSTFRDMQEEREHLVKKIFPEIRALCRSRGIIFTEIDLRWGLTDEDVALGQVIRACLEEIDRCRPYFIGITGDRYGYIPELHEYYKDPELLANYPWLEEAALEGSSVIDLEMRHGALNDPESARSGSLFFFRRHRPTDEPDAEASEELRRLEDLKRRIRASGLPVEEYRDPGTLGEMAYDALVEIIERDFAAVVPLTPLESERTRHRIFAESRRRAYIPNSVYLGKLNDWFAAEENVPMILYAESGSGKSSLISFWCEQLRRRRPELEIVEHYVGIGAGAGDHLTIMRHIMAEIAERFDRSEEPPDKPEEIELEFANWLGYTVGKPLLLVIDGVNQLQGEGLNLHWLPPVMPEGVKLIISSTVEGTLVDLRKRGWQTLGMQPLNEKEREAVTVRFLAEYHKALSPEQVRKISSDIKSAHPLFLRTVLEELRLAAWHDTLDLEIDRYLDSTGTEDLFQHVLERMEEDHGRRSVAEVFSFMWCSRSGLEENDLQELTGLPRLKLSTMLGSLEYHLVRREGSLTFFHDYLRRAVEKRYLADATQRERMHGKLAWHFRRTLPALRSVRELLWQYDQGSDEQSMKNLLSRPDIVSLLWSGPERWELPAHWSRLMKKGHSVEEAFRTGLETWRAGEGQSDPIGTLRAVADLLELLGCWEMVLELHAEMADLAASAGDTRRQLEAHLGAGSTCALRGEYDRGLEHLATADRLARELNDRRATAYTLAGRGHVYMIQTRYEEGLEYFTQALAIHQELGDRRGMASCISNIGVIHASVGRYTEALEHHHRHLELCRELGNRRGTARTTGHIGIIHAGQGRYEEGLEYYRRALATHEELGDRQSIGTTLGNIGALLLEQGRYAEALPYCDRYLELSEELGDRRGMAAALNNAGVAYTEQGRYEEGLECFTRYLTLSEELGDRYRTARALSNIGALHADMGRPERGLDYYARQLELSRELDDPFGVGIAMGRTGTIYAVQNRRADALECFRLALEVHRTIPSPHYIVQWTREVARLLLETASEGGPAPEYLGDWIAPEPEEEWTRAALRAARERAEESLTLSREIAVDGSITAARILLAQIAVAEGKTDAGLEELRRMLEETTSEIELAELHYHLAELDPDHTPHRAEALRRYKALCERMPKREFRKRVEELEGESLRSHYQRL